MLIIYLKNSVICIFNEHTEEYIVKTSEKDSSIAIVTWESFKMERLINPESCTPEREIILANL